ncbi:uncharacterized protein LOC121874342 [Homarus americanus]|uniref:uncharacterized protein LOC121874342 n=1 Tax=Homarus americanus TaxID=6706 RepID=UPI001C46C4A4|nr:uncharacterized protein LOC121874342 [Homarus americanus]
MSVDKTRANRWVSLALLTVLGVLGLVFLLQAAAMVFGPSKSACTKQVCLAKFLEGPPAFNDVGMSTYLRNNHFLPPTASGYQLSGINGRTANFDAILQYIKEYFNNKRGGVFVDVGAGDGEYRSVTLELEKTLGWTGLLVEPNEHLYKKILKKGRKAQLTKACISPYSYPTVLKLAYPVIKEGASEEEEVKTLSQTKLHRLWDQQIETGLVAFEAQCVPLENLIYAAGITKSFDLLVLDMSGTDLDILLNTRMDVLPAFEMILIHANGANVGNDIGGYFLECNMVIKKVFGNSAETASYVLVKFDARKDL